MDDNDDFGFCPYIRVGNITVIGRIGRSANNLALTGLPWSVRERSHFVFELPFAFNKGETPKLEQVFDTCEVRCWRHRARGIEALIEHTRKIEMRVLKARVPDLIRCWASPNPYTDENCVLMGFDDIIALMLSC